MNMTVRELVDIIEQRYGDPDRFILTVRHRLGRRKITQQQLADACGFDSTHLNRWLNGHVQPSLKNMLLVDEGLERLLTPGGETVV